MSNDERELEGHMGYRLCRSPRSKGTRPTGMTIGEFVGKARPQSGRVPPKTPLEWADLSSYPSTIDFVLAVTLPSCASSIEVILGIQITEDAPPSDASS